MQMMAPAGAAALGASMTNHHHRHHHGMSPVGAAAVGATVARHPRSQPQPAQEEVVKEKGSFAPTSLRDDAFTSTQKRHEHYGKFTC